MHTIFKKNHQCVYSNGQSNYTKFFLMWKTFNFVLVVSVGTQFKYFSRYCISSKILHYTNGHETSVLVIYFKNINLVRGMLHFKPIDNPESIINFKYLKLIGNMENSRNYVSWHFQPKIWIPDTIWRLEALRIDTSDLIWYKSCLWILQMLWM